MTTDISQDAARLTKIYRKIRDAKSKLNADHKKQEEVLDEQLATVSRMLMDLMNKQNVTGLQTEHGRVAKVIKQKFWSTDWSEFDKFVLENGLPGLFERRIAQTNMAEYLAANPEKIPPGLQIDRRYDVLVVKPTKKPE